MSNMLSSWKEIAQFFGKGVRTVQRWEKTLDLPIHRPPGAPSNVVLAKESDLEAWMNRGMNARQVQASDVSNHALESVRHAIRDLADERRSAGGHLSDEGRKRAHLLHQQIEELRSALHQAVDGEDVGSIAA